MTNHLNLTDRSNQELFAMIDFGLTLANQKGISHKAAMIIYDQVDDLHDQLDKNFLAE